MLSLRFVDNGITHAQELGHRVIEMLERLLSYYSSLSPGSQVMLLSAFSLLFASQAVKRYEEETFTAFLLALGALILFWLAFSKAF